MLLTWSQFCKEPLPERNFTFWEWFYALMKLTREHLRAPWMDKFVLNLFFYFFLRALFVTFKFNAVLSLVLLAVSKRKTC